MVVPPPQATTEPHADLWDTLASPTDTEAEPKNYIDPPFAAHTAAATSVGTLGTSAEASAGHPVEAFFSACGLGAFGEAAVHYGYASDMLKYPIHSMPNCSYPRCPCACTRYETITDLMDPGLVTPSDLQELGLNPQQIELFNSAIRAAAKNQPGQPRPAPAAAATATAGSLASFSAASVSSATSTGASAKSVPASASSVASSQSRKSSLEDALADASLAEAEAEAAEREANAAWERTVATVERNKAREAEAQAREQRQQQRGQQQMERLKDEAEAQKTTAAVVLPFRGSGAAVDETKNTRNGNTINDPISSAIKPKAVIDTSYLSSDDDDSDDDNVLNERDVAPMSSPSLSSGWSFVPSISSSSSSQSSASSAAPPAPSSPSPAVPSAPSAPLPTLSAAPSASSALLVASTTLAPITAATVVAPAVTVPSKQPIACPRCTLENDAAATQCVMCEMTLQSSASGTSSSAAQALAQMRSGLAAHDSLRGRTQAQGPYQESQKEETEPALDAATLPQPPSGNNSVEVGVGSTTAGLIAGATAITVKQKVAVPSTTTTKPRLSAQGLFESISERDQISTGARTVDTEASNNRKSKSDTKSVAIDPSASWLALLSLLGMEVNGNEGSIVEELLRGHPQAASEMERVLAAAEVLKAENAHLKAKAQCLEVSNGNTAAAASAAEVPPILSQIQQESNSLASTTAAVPALPAPNSQRAPWMRIGRKVKGQHEPDQVTREDTKAAEIEREGDSIEIEEKEKEKTWSCTMCTLSNKASEKACAVCGWEHLPGTSSSVDISATATATTSAESATDNAATTTPAASVTGESAAAGRGVEVSAGAEATPEVMSVRSHKSIGGDVIMREIDEIDLKEEGNDGSDNKGSDGLFKGDALNSESSSSLPAVSSRRGSLFRGVRKSVAASTGLHGVFSKGTKLGGDRATTLTTSDRSDDDESEVELNDGGASSSKHGSNNKSNRRSSKADAKEAAVAALRRQKVLEAESVEAERLALFRAAASQADASLTLPQTRVRLLSFRCSTFVAQPYPFLFLGYFHSCLLLVFTLYWHACTIISLPLFSLVFASFLGHAR